MRRTIITEAALPRRMSSAKYFKTESLTRKGKTMSYREQKQHIRRLSVQASERVRFGSLLCMERFGSLGCSIVRKHGDTSNRSEDSELVLDSTAAKTN